ncbi:S8 family peptidase [Motiliproteus sp.]|uniref:S8 family peptidase n=1 Tax=Motiliproteus sp. TaxID=1898955 RepID=UPI003BA951BC
MFRKSPLSIALSLTLALSTQAMLVTSTHAVEESVEAAAAEASDAFVRSVIAEIQADPEQAGTILRRSVKSSAHRYHLDPAIEAEISQNAIDPDKVVELVGQYLEQDSSMLISLYQLIEAVGSHQSQIRVEMFVRESVTSGELYISEDKVAYSPNLDLGNSKLVLGGLAVAAAAGGGGGGGGGGSAPVWAPLPASPFSPTAAEYSANSTTHTMVGVKAAHDRGYTGVGATIAVLDSGFLSTHEELSGQFDDLYNPITNRSGVDAASDPHGHGTHVAGIIAAKGNGTGIVGVAPGAHLIGIRISDASGSVVFGESHWGRTVDRLIARGTDFVNNSWGATITVADVPSAAAYESAFPNEISALRRAVAADQVWVWATGNDGPTVTQPSVNAALPELFPELEQHWVAVTSVDAVENLSSFAQPCGNAANWCVAAPGENVLSSYRNGGYITDSGTSMATPYVTGVLALLKQRFPTLSNDQIVDRLFLTAKDLGAAGVDSVYGHGLVDADKATDPLGPLSVVVPVTSSSSVTLTSAPLSTSLLTLSSAFGDGLKQALQGQSLAVADTQGAGFFVDLASLTRSLKPSLDLSTALDRYRSTPELQQAQLTPDSRLSFSTRNDAGTIKFDQLMYRYRPSAGSQLRLGFSDELQQFVGLNYGSSISGSYLGANFSAPYTGLSQSKMGLGYSLSLQGMELAFSAVVPHGSNDEETRASALIGSVSIPLGEQLQTSFQVGYALEENALLGASGEGAFAFGESTPTLYVGAQTRWQLAPDTELAGSVYLGRSRPELAQGSLISQVSAVTSSSFSLGLGHQLDDGRRLGFIASQPLRVEGGSMSMSISDGYAGSRFNRVNVDADLSPNAREIDLELFYQFKGKRLDNLRASLIHQINPGHQRVASDNLLLLTLDNRF